MRATSAILATVVLGLQGLAAAPALAGPTWDSLRAEIYGGRTLQDGAGVIRLKAPYRPDNNMSVPLEMSAHLGKGQTIKTVSFIVDENPSPVAAKFTVGGKRESVAITTNIRLNQQSDVHIVVETASGELYVVEQLVKFAGGQASCSAPPTGDPAEIAANMGKMQFSAVGQKANASHALQRARFELSHPNHTGMVLDQMTLLYVPLLMVDHIEARQGDEMVFEMEGSITLNQNPKVEFDYVTNGAEEMTISARDTSGAKWEQKFPIGPAG